MLSILFLQTKIRGYYDFVWERCRDAFGSTALEGLPVQLQSQVAKYTHHTMLKASPVFDGMPDQFIQLLALKLDQHFTMPDEVVFRCGVLCNLLRVLRVHDFCSCFCSVTEDATDMYFIRAGTVVLLKSSFVPSEKAPFVPNNFIPLVHHAAAVSATPRPTTASSIKPSRGLNLIVRVLMAYSIHGDVPGSVPSCLHSLFLSQNKVRAMSPRHGKSRRISNVGHPDEAVLSWRREGGYFGDDAVIDDDDHELQLDHPERRSPVDMPSEAQPVYVNSAQV